MYSQKLFDLLTPSELKVLKSQTEVRNVTVNDITIEELFRVKECLLHWKTKDDLASVTKVSLPIPARVLIELYERSFDVAAQEQEQPKQVKSKSNSLPWYCDKWFSGGEICYSQCQFCKSH